MEIPVRWLASTNAGKASIALLSLSVSLFTAGALWGFVTDSEKELDLAKGVLRISFLVALFGTLLVVQHRETLRRRNR